MLAAAKVKSKEVVFCFSEPNVRQQKPSGFGSTKTILGKKDGEIPKVGIAMPTAVDALHLCHLDTDSMVTVALETGTGMKRSVIYLTSIYLNKARDLAKDIAGLDAIRES